MIEAMITLAGHPWDSRSQRLLADGAWGTELMKRGLKSGAPPEQMNIEQPDVIRELALTYLRAGSDVFLTNSFVGSRLQLERHGLGDRAADLNRKAAEIATLAVADFMTDGTAEQRSRAIPRPLVAGSVGPTGKLVVMGEIDTEELLDVFSEQMTALAEGGADIILVESMADMQEMIVAVRAAKTATSLPIVASMTYDKVKDGYRTVMGDTPKACVEAALEEGASIVGANCGTGIDNYVGLADELCALDLAPVWIKANAGLPELVGSEITYKQTADEYADFVPRLLNSGVSIVGGCCGTSPQFVEAMRRELDAWRAK
jgi:5-methyltetrahydrofolate--homocysteine methyltransferase